MLLVHCVFFLILSSFFFSLFLPYPFFCWELMFFMFFFYTVLLLVTCFFFPILLFYLFFLLLSIPDKILAESHHEAPVTTFSTIFSHREILLNRLPNGSKHIRFRYGHRKRAPAQPLEDISSEWNPQPPCWDHQKLLWQLYLLCWWWWFLIWSRHMGVLCLHCFSILL